MSFYWAGLDVSLSLRRADDGRVVVTRGESHEYVFDVPRDVTVTQEVITVDRGGKRTSTRTCKPTKL